MNKKIIYVLMILIIIIGGVIVGVMGLEADIPYSKNTRIDVYLGVNFENKDIKQIVQEVFGNVRTIVQKVEYYDDMASITIKQDYNKIENLTEKKEQLNTKINEKYGLENKADDITITEQPKIKLSSVLTPYITPIAISVVTILVYVLIRYRKQGVFKVLASYVVSILAVEALLLSVLAITRLPIGRWIMPVGLLAYIITLTVVTAKLESKK